MALIRRSLRHRSLGQPHTRGTIHHKFRLWPTAPHFEGKFSRGGLRALPLGCDQRPAPVLTSRNMTTKTGAKEGKHGVFFGDLPRFLPKIGGFFRRLSEQPIKKAFHRAPMSGETLFFMRCLRNLACGGFAPHSNRRAVQPSTHCATACATPSSSLESVTRSATAFTSSAALAIATPMPAKRNMARSLKPSPNAMSCSRDKPR